MKRSRAIEIIIQSLNGDELIVSSTGMISRELFALKDTPRNFYMLGSMGLASSIGLGLALNLPDRRVVVLDGDGACLMNLGALATIGELSPKNLMHIVLNNGCYGSTGGQPTAVGMVELEQVARYTGYMISEFVEDEDELREALELRNLVFILVEIDKGDVEGIGRVSYPPEEIKGRFRENIKESNNGKIE